MDNRKLKITLILLCIIVATFIIIFNLKQSTSLNQSNFIKNSNVSPRTQNDSANPNSKFVIPNSLLLNIPFTPQAPTANWDQLHNEACEEANSLMAGAYFKGMRDTTLKPEYVESEITKLTDWQKEHQGYYLDQTSEEVATMINSVYSLKTKLLNNFSAGDLKQELAAGHLVLISENGRLLGNPNYKSPGPLHHMLLIKGFDKMGFITNDSGTKRGLNYAYDFSTIYNAAGDWDHSSNNIDTAKKIAIVVWKE